MRAARSLVISEENKRKGLTLRSRGRTTRQRDAAHEQGPPDRGEPCSHAATSISGLISAATQRAVSGALRPAGATRPATGAPRCMRSAQLRSLPRDERRPALRFCGSPGPVGSGRHCAPRIHENAVLRADRRRPPAGGRRAGTRCWRCARLEVGRRADLLSAARGAHRAGEVRVAIRDAGRAAEGEQHALAIAEKHEPAECRRALPLIGYSRSLAHLPETRPYAGNRSYDC
jgi:hypothetical protein